MAACMPPEPHFGVDVLRSSARRDLVALLTEDVSASAAKTLAADGWHVRRVPTVLSPSDNGPSIKRGDLNARFWAVYTKMLVFNMTEYSTGAVAPAAAEQPACGSRSSGSWSSGFPVALPRGARARADGPHALPHTSHSGLPGCRHPGPAEQ
jgi:hypothetical protein